MVIIWTNYDVQESQLLHTKFRWNQPNGTKEGDFWWVLPCTDMVAILVMWPALFQQIFISSYLKDYKQNLVQIDKRYLIKSGFDFHM